MTTVPLGQETFKRNYAQQPLIELLNRFLEKNPTNQVEGIGLLARPGNDYFIGAGSGQIRSISHQQGCFNDDLFFVVGEDLYRWDQENAPVAIAGTILGNGYPSVTYVAGADYEHLFIADGQTLQYYAGISAAGATLTVSGAGIVSGDTLTVDAAWYEFTNGSVDAGTPAGTMANPYLIAMGVDDEAALLNMLKALNLTGLAGTDYSTTTVINANVKGETSSATTLGVKARVAGAAGNTIPVAEAGANLGWSSPMLTGGGAQALNGVPTPDDTGIVSLATLASHVVCVAANSQRFYWILPGETVIDPLNFAEAESEPDQLIQVLRVGDALYFLGQSSTEVWYFAGTVDATFLRQQGLAFSQGTLEGTAVQVRNKLYLVAEDGIGYEVSNGPVRFTTNAIEEHIRAARAAIEGS